MKKLIFNLNNFDILLNSKYNTLELILKNETIPVVTDGFGLPGIIGPTIELDIVDYIQQIVNKQEDLSRGITWRYSD